jgi:hypothetical protein
MNSFVEQMSAEREDFLTEDPEIPSQRWCLLSFLSPEKVLNRKELFFFNAFLKQYEFQVRSQSLEKYLVETVKGINEKLEKEAVVLEQQDLSGAAALCRNSVVRIDTVMQSFHEYIKKNMKDLGASKLTDEYDDYLFKNKLKLEDDFYAVNDFKTTVRGLKVRGVYSSKEEAESRAKKLQRSDQIHNIFVGEVGKWLPWDPSPHEVGDQEYAEDQLNTLMKKYKENEEAREAFHREQRESGRKQKRVFTAPDEPSSTPAVTMTRQDSESNLAAAVPSLGTGASEFAGMFSSSGPADLAIARKLEK